MFVVDTNILLYAVDRSSLLHDPAYKLVNALRHGHDRWYLPWGVINEFLRVATHHKVFANPLTFSQAWSFIQALLEAPSSNVLAETEKHADSVTKLSEKIQGLAGNLVFDFHIAVLMHENGLRHIYTNDMDFHRFAWVDVVNPFS